MRSSSKIAVHFESLEDPRVVGRTAHPLLTVIVMAVVGLLVNRRGGGAHGATPNPES